MQRRLLLLLSVSMLCIATAPAGQKQASGRIETFHFVSKLFNNTRYVRVWVPPQYDDPAHASDRFPVLYMNDGQFAFHNVPIRGRGGDWRADETAARLIKSGKIEPLIIVAIDNGGTQRAREYLPVDDEYYKPPLREVHGDRYPEVLFDELMPAINARFRTRTDANSTALCGSSYGAVAALYAVMKRPGKVGRLLLESPSLYVRKGWLLKQAKELSIWPEKIYVGIGTNEMPQDQQGSREAVQGVVAFQRILKDAGVGNGRIRVNVEQGATHNEAAWAGRFGTALEFLFGTNKPGR